MNYTNAIRALVEKELEADRAFDDVTVQTLGSEAEASCEATVVVKKSGVFAGEEIALAIKEIFHERVKVSIHVKNGDPIQAGDKVITLSGPIGLCLSIERTLLNFVTLLSGVATLTRQFVESVGARPTKILATRKTVPGLRDLQLSAVVAGGGFIHRRSLSDGILIKDNHIEMVGIQNILNRAEKTRSPLHRVEIEVQNLNQVKQALEGSCDVIMLDNMGIPEMQEAITLIREKTAGRTKIEVSGGVTLETVSQFAALGVDYISVGMLTHSAPQLNMSMDFKR